MTRSNSLPTLQRSLSHSCTASPQTPTCPQIDSWCEEGGSPLTFTRTARVCGWDVVCAHGNVHAVCEWCVCVCVCVCGVSDVELCVCVCGEERQPGMKYSLQTQVN